MFPQADILNVDSLASQGFWVLNPVNHQNTQKKWLQMAKLFNNCKNS